MTRRSMEALWQMIRAGIHVQYNRHLIHRGLGKPGAIINNAPSEVREALAELRSDELAQERFDPARVMGEEYEENRRQRRERLAFDKKLKLWP